MKGSGAGVRERGVSHESHGGLRALLEPGVRAALKVLGADVGCLCAP